MATDLNEEPRFRPSRADRKELAKLFKLLYGYSEAAKILGMSKTQVWKLVNEPDSPSEG